MKIPTSILLLAALLVAVVFRPTIAHAQIEKPLAVRVANPQLAVGYHIVSPRRTFTSKRVNRSINGGVAALTLSGIGVAVGVGLTISGSLDCLFECSAKGSAMRVAGATSIAVGFAGMIAGGIILKSGKLKRRELQRVRSEVRIGAGNASLKLAF